MSNIYQRALNKWGFNAQRWAFVEEVSEVMQAFSHERRDRCNKNKVLHELIDVQIVLNSVKLIYTDNYEWDSLMQEAEERLKQKIINEDLGMVKKEMIKK